MTTADQVRELVAPLVERRQLELYDLELAGGVLRVLVDAPGGADLAAIAAVTREVSRALDEHDPIAGSYTLEVSTPGLERTLRTPEHFARAVGDAVRIKTRPGTDGERRIAGAVAAADDDGVTIRLDEPDPTGATERHVRYDDIERARTVFEWGPAPKHERKQKA